jgi:cyclic pyranopterin phosphate synthase
LDALIDRFGRSITYLRLSVTDRCDLRCRYCMPADAHFSPKRDVLTLEELAEVASAFIDRGVAKLRITGGEPLMRKNVLWLFQSLSARLADGALKELTLTTNGTRLAEFAGALAALGVRRVNVSLDTLDRALFARIARRDALPSVLSGIEAARAAGLAVKINTVALKGDNRGEIPALIEWAHERGMDLTLIEVMPMGEIGEDRLDQYVPLSELRADLGRRWTLVDCAHKTAGPARYTVVKETGGRLGFITPLTHNFCESCNRARLTCTGELYMCLGREDRADLRTALRSGGRQALDAAISEAIARKPRGHDFAINRRGGEPAVARVMAATGG